MYEGGAPMRMHSILLALLCAYFVVGFSACGGGVTTTIMEEERTETTETTMNPMPVNPGTPEDIVVLQSMSRTGEDGAVPSDTVIQFNGNTVLDGHIVTLERDGLLAHMSMAIVADVVTTEGPPMPVTDTRVDGFPLCNGNFVVNNEQPSSLDLADGEVVYKYNFQKFQHSTEWREVAVSGTGQVDPRLSIVSVANQLELQPMTTTTTTHHWCREEVVKEEDGISGGFGLLGLLGLAFGNSPIGTVVQLTCGDPVDSDTFIVRIPPSIDGPPDLEPENRLPIARLTANPISGELTDDRFCTTLDASASFDQDGDMLEYRFRFGDGSDPTDWMDTPAVQHCFTRIGNFVVSVDVRDEHEALNTATSNVFVIETPPPPPPDNEPPVAILQLVGDAVSEVPFTVTVDASASYDTDGFIREYDYYFFGDGGRWAGGSSTTCNHTYTNPGKYTIWLRVTDDDSAQDWTDSGLEVVVTESQPQNNPPVAVAEAAPMSGEAPLSVWFSGWFSYDPDSDDDVVYWEWDFGDGSGFASTYGWLVEHVYYTSGMYAATLTVTDSHGATDTTRVGSIVVEAPPPANLPPVASFTATPTNGYAPLTVQFDANVSYDPDGTIVDYQWDYDDGGGGNGITPSHTYTVPGIYTVILTVTDDDGATDQASSATITVEQEPANQSPVASFTATPDTGDAPLVVQFDGSASYDPDGTIVDYDWDFDDGTGTGVTSSHTYTVPGIYTVILTVTDDDGATDQTSSTITALDPEVYEAFITPEDAAIDIPDEATFSGVLLDSQGNDVTPPDAVITFSCDESPGSIDPNDGVFYSILSGTGTFTIWTHITVDDDTWSDSTMLTVN